jgi:hypothetical protein
MNPIYLLTDYNAIYKIIDIHRQQEYIKRSFDVFALAEHSPRATYTLRLTGDRLP